MLAGLVGALGAKYIRSRMSALPQLRTVKMERRDLCITVGTTGTIEPEEIVEVGASVAGKIVSLGRNIGDPNQSIDVGSRVAKDSVLVQLDSQLYEVGLQKAQASLRLAEAEVGRLETQLHQANRDLERAQRLRDTNSQSEFDRITTAYEMAQAELAIGRARREQAAAEVKQAEINLEHTTIRAPIDGVAIDRRTNLGQNVSPGMPGLFLLARNLDRMRIRASVSETDIGKVVVGQRVTFSVDAHRDMTMTGRVEKILLNARIQGNFVTYDVLVAIDHPPTRLLPHMTADVEFETLKRERAWLVPTGAFGWWPSAEQIDPSSAAIKRQESVSTTDGPAEGDSAFVWVPTEEGFVRPIQVRVGVDDGVVTEVIGEGFREEMPVVVGTIKRTALSRIIPSVKTVR